ncbi:HET-domain-containing protein [Xylaria cf. heliscus]|nr:HET-domain-containing protein [Xylaria cf. heliscus]
MENLTNHGATLLGQRLGAILNGAIVANMTLFFDWIIPSWCKIAYVVFDHILRARQSDKSVVASKLTWRTRLQMASAWLGMCIAYLTWAPNRRLIMIYHGVTGHGANLLIWSGISMQKDGPRDAMDKVQEAYLDSTISFLISSYSLTHRTLVWGLVKWTSIKVGIPLVCISGTLYYLREVLPLTRIYYQVQYYVFISISKAWDSFDYVEAQIVERLPRYLQREWSSYQQRRPERTELPTYRYQPLNAGSVRLLILKRSPLYPSVIQAEIVHRPIYPPPDYEAVSYRWGSAELTEEIIVDGCRFPVTKSAFDVLLARRSVWRERTIWIDAICINQEDLQEKSEQIQLMRDIYFRASRVVSYPGSDWRYRLAGAFIYQLWSLSYQYNTEAMDWQATPDEARSPRWRAMADLFTNEYFNRAWVIQEVAVGQKNELYVGGIYIPWMVFAEVMQWCFHSSRRHMLTGSHEKERRIWRPGRTFENVAVMTTLRPEAETWTGAIGSFRDLIDLEKLLYLTFNFRAADPRDKVFGLIGVARSTGDTTLVVPDYNLPVEQVFQNAARVVFSLSPERRTIHILALAGTGFSKRPKRMPSWVPDFSEDRTWYPYSDIAELSTGTRFKASGDSPQDLRIDNEANSIVVKAIVIDRVLDLSEFGALDWGLHDFEVADMFKIIPILHGFVDAALRLCLKHFKLSSIADVLTLDRLWLAFTAGLIERKPADMKFKDVFRHWWLNLCLVTSAQDRSHYNQLVKDGALNEGWDFTADGSETLYQYSVVETCFGRRFAITDSGRLCIVPPLTKAGDSVIIPLGSQTPFLIRQRDGESKDIGYELIGEAWVEGVMQGEMIGNADEELIRIS